MLLIPIKNRENLLFGGFCLQILSAIPYFYIKKEPHTGCGSF